MTTKLSLDDLVIRASSHTPFFGVYLASHAIPDSLCMCHASVGCKVKTQQHLVDHDGIADAHNRRRYSQFIDEDLIQGSTQQLEEEISAFQGRRDSKVVLIDSSTPISLQGQSLGPVCRRLEDKLGVHVVAVDARNYDSDLWEGYDAAMATLLARQSWPPLDQTESDEIAVVGYPFDRYEPDHTGTVAELRRLLFGIGLQARAVLLAGEPYATLQQITQSLHIVLLPWAQERTEKALLAAGRKPIRAGLPMGLDGTGRWLRGIAAAVDAAERGPSASAGAAKPGSRSQRAERVVQHENARIKELYALAHRRLAGRGFAAFGEAPRVAGLTALLMEVGMIPACLGTTHFSLGGPAEVEVMLRAQFGRELPSGVTWLADPTPVQLRSLARERAAFWQQSGPGAGARGDQERRGGQRGDGPSSDGPRGDGPPLPDARLPALARAEVVIGTTLDRDELEAAALPFVEFGFPSERYHAIFPAPWMGTNGALRLLERVLVALEMRDAGGRR